MLIDSLFIVSEPGQRLATKAVVGVLFCVAGGSVGGLGWLLRGIVLVVYTTYWLIAGKQGNQWHRLH